VRGKGDERYNKRGKSAKQVSRKIEQKQNIGSRSMGWSEGVLTWLMMLWDWVAKRTTMVKRRAARVRGPMRGAKEE